MLIYSSTGGTPESQREFLETFSADTSEPGLANDKRKGRIPPIANQFALGYTYQDVLDADQEGDQTSVLNIGTFRRLTDCPKRYPSTSFRIPPLRTLTVLCPPPQTALDPSVRPGNIGRAPAGLVRPVDMGPATERMDPSPSTGIDFAR